MSPRPARPWFRFYVEALWDRKLRRHPPSYRWLWVAVLGVARSSPTPGVLLVGDGHPADVDDLADAASLRPSDVKGGLVALEKLGMIEERDGAWRVVRWDERQFEGDSSTERTRKSRSKEQVGNSQTASEGTGPETEADTDTEPTRGDAARVPFEDEFEQAWRHYPLKLARKAALKAYQARRRSDVASTALLRATINFAAAMLAEGRPRDKIMHGATFYGPNDRWRDYLEAEPSGDDGASKPRQVCPDHGAGACFFQPGSGWVHVRGAA